MNFTDEEQILPESLTGKKDMISGKMTEHGMKLKNGMSFYWKNICKQKTAPESGKVDPVLFLFPFKVQVCMVFLHFW